MKLFKTRSPLQLSFLLLALLALVSCTNTLSIITLISVAVDAGANVLTASGTLTPVVRTYIQQGEDALAFTTTELASTDTSIVKTAKIAEKILAITQPDLTGAPTNVVIAVASFSAALSAVLAYVQAGQAQLRMTANGGAPPPKGAEIILPTESDAKTLLKLHNKAQLASLKAKQ